MNALIEVIKRKDEKMVQGVYPGVNLYRTTYAAPKTKSIDFATLFLCFYGRNEYFASLYTAYDAKQDNFLKEHPKLLLLVNRFFENGGSELYILNYPLDKGINSISVNNFLKNNCDGLSNLEQICTIGLLQNSQYKNEIDLNKVIEVIYTVNQYTYETDRISITDINDIIKDTYLDRLGETIIYHPWFVDNELTAIPPSIIAASLNSKLAHEGVFFHSIANKNILNLQQLSEDLSTIENQELHKECINPIIPVHTQGLKVWGIKAFNSNYESANEMRVVKYIKRYLKRISKEFIFESNSSNLSGKIFLEVNQFLTFLWEQGALSGSAKEEAFVVRESLKNLDSSKTLLSFEILVAVTKPLEFITIKLNRIDNNGAQESFKLES